MNDDEIKKLEQIRQIVTVLVTDAVANRQAELQEANKELTERSRLLDLQIKAKEATLRGLDALIKSTQPDQPAMVDVAKDMADLDINEEV